MRGGLLALVAVTGCFRHHVDLPTLPATLTPAQRVEVYARFHPAARGVERETICGQHGCSTSSTDILILGDGTRIREAEDLLPLLPAESPAATAARRVDQLHTRQMWWKLGALASFAGGIYVASKAWGVSDTFTKVGFSLMFGGPVACGVGWAIDQVRAAHATRTVFGRYDEAMVSRLSLCVNGLALVPCESNVPGELPDAAVVDPALGSLRQK